MNSPFEYYIVYYISLFFCVFELVKCVLSRSRSSSICLPQHTSSHLPLRLERRVSLQVVRIENKRLDEKPRTLRAKTDIFEEDELSEERDSFDEV